MESKYLPAGFLNKDEVLQFETKKVSNPILPLILVPLSFFMWPLFFLSIPALWYYLEAEKTVYAITNQRVLVIRSFLGKKITQCPLSKIQNINMQKGWMATAGDIKFDTAGGPNKELNWDIINNPENVLSIISPVIHK